MMMLAEACQLLDAELRHGDAEFARVVTDSRGIQPGDLFVALRGERFDAHQFVAQAHADGASAALVSEWVADGIPQLRVDDTLLGLQHLSRHWRQRFRLPVVAVTGSNGKTTSKQMLASIFAARGPVLATVGNLNNHIGVPLTLLALRAEHATAVIEMGANHHGEIASLAALAKPDIGLITQAGDAHLEGFGSREGVARAKGELFAALDGGVAVINADDVYAPLWRQLAARASVISFGIDAAADVQAQQIQLGVSGSRFVLRTPAGSASVNLPMPGRHNVLNALGAAACAIALGMEPEVIAAGLAQAQAAQGRLNWQQTPQGARLLDDSYNANPSSLRVGMELLAQLPGRRLLVLGGMAELGADAPQMHYAAGQLARELGLDGLFGMGPLAAEAVRGFGAGAYGFNTVDELAGALRDQLDADVVVLVKGSRSARMERVVAALTGDAARGAH